MIPGRPIPTSATRRGQSSRSPVDAPTGAWSVPITTIRSGGQPNATARWRSAYWRSTRRCGSPGVAWTGTHTDTGAREMLSGDLRGDGARAHLPATHGSATVGGAPTISSRQPAPRRRVGRGGVVAVLGQACAQAARPGRCSSASPSRHPNGSPSTASRPIAHSASTSSESPARLIVALASDRSARASARPTDRRCIRTHSAPRSALPARPTAARNRPRAARARTRHLLGQLGRSPRGHQSGQPARLHATRAS